MLLLANIEDEGSVLSECCPFIITCISPNYLRCTSVSILGFVYTGVLYNQLLC